jgi:hypothetical protein
MSKTMKAMRAVALKLAGVEEGVACEGTAIEKRTVKVNGKAFLFLGVGDALLKLEGSLPAATKLATKAPDRYRVGKGGWVKIVFSDDDAPPMGVVTKWIAESHSLASAPKPRANPRANAKKK